MSVVLIVFAPLALALSQQDIVRRWSEGRPLKIERSVSAICSARYRFTVALVTDQSARVMSVAVNGKPVSENELQRLSERVGADHVIEVQPFECLGDHGEKGVALLLITLANDRKTQGSLFTRLVPADDGWTFTFEKRVDKK